MPTIWTNRLSAAQHRVLEACVGRGVLGGACQKGILPVFLDTKRTINGLLTRGLVREVGVPDYARNGITLTHAGAETLVPESTVTYL